VEIALENKNEFSLSAVLRAKLPRTVPNKSPHCVGFMGCSLAMSNNLTAELRDSGSVSWG